MGIRRLKLVQFKNHERLEVDADPKWNAFIGLNGSGKTNALDAIYMSCVSKSFLHHSLDQCIQHEKDFFRLEVDYADLDQLVIKYPAGGPRSILINDDKVQKISDFIGRQPVVIIQPIDDYRLLQASSERRRIIDQALSQMDPQYMDALLKYTKVIRQRNTLLKQMRQRGSSHRAQLQTYEPALQQYQSTLHDGRAELIASMAPHLDVYYRHIAQDKESPTIAFAPSISSDNYLGGLREAQAQDLASGRTSIGPHLDDVDMHLDGHELKKVGSQGQRKSFLIAMKLAIYQILYQHNGRRPILLLDDLFDKLDMVRVRRLLDLLEQDEFGQIFISEKDGSLLESILDEMGHGFQLIRL